MPHRSSRSHRIGSTVLPADFLVSKDGEERQFARLRKEVIRESSRRDRSRRAEVGDQGSSAGEEVCSFGALVSENASCSFGKSRGGFQPQLWRLPHLRRCEKLERRRRRPSVEDQTQSRRRKNEEVQQLSLPIIKKREDREKEEKRCPRRNSYLLIFSFAFFPLLFFYFFFSLTVLKTFCFRNLPPKIFFVSWARCCKTKLCYTDVCVCDRSSSMGSSGQISKSRASKASTSWQATSFLNEHHTCSRVIVVPGLVSKG